MVIFSKLMQRFEAAAAASRQAELESFLADATDISDVEARLLVWDRRQAEMGSTYPALQGLQLH
jgi:hypothetical protein